MQEIMVDPVFMTDIDTARTFKQLRADKSAGELCYHVEDPDNDFKHLAVFRVPLEGGGFGSVPFVSKDAKHWVICLWAQKNGAPIDLRALIDSCEEARDGKD